MVGIANQIMKTSGEVLPPFLTVVARILGMCRTSVHALLKLLVGKLCAADAQNLKIRIRAPDAGQVVQGRVQLAPGEIGGTGDLTRRKLIPALYDLACIGCTNPNFEVLGIGRTQLTDEQFQERMHRGAAHSKDARNYSEEGWKDFAGRLHYLVGDANHPDFYPALKANLQAMQKRGASKNVLFYVSTPASLAPPIVEGLGQAGLANNSEGWTRIILEKPFGHDLKSAQELNDDVSHVFPEDSIYRIDHYLGKETVQNIMVFRFGNSMFEP